MSWSERFHEDFSGTEPFFKKAGPSSSLDILVPLPSCRFFPPTRCLIVFGFFFVFFFPFELPFNHTVSVILEKIISSFWLVSELCCNCYVLRLRSQLFARLRLLQPCYHAALDCYSICLHLCGGFAATILMHKNEFRTAVRSSSLPGNKLRLHSQVEDYDILTQIGEGAYGFALSFTSVNFCNVY